MLSAFDILKPLDEYGTPIDPMVEYDFGLTLYACVGFSAFKLCLLLTMGIFLTGSQSRSNADSNPAMKESKH